MYSILQVCLSTAQEIFKSRFQLQHTLAIFGEIHKDDPKGNNFRKTHLYLID